MKLLERKGNNRYKSILKILPIIIKRISLFFELAIHFYRLLIGIFNLMRNRKNIEDLITVSLTGVLERSLTLERKDQIAISQEFKEWIHGVTKEEDIWVIDNPIK